MTVVRDQRGSPSRLKLPKDFDPAWDIVALFPPQGEWSEEDYLRFGEKLDTHRLVELVDGRIEVLPAPTEEHQLIVLFLIEALRAFTRPRDLGMVLFSGLRVRMRARNFREPDVVFLSRKNEDKRGNRFWRGADLAIEVVSEDDPERDYVDKRAEYARAGIKEYWVVDPRDRTITLLTLQGRAYAERGVYRGADEAKSQLLPGFSVRAADVFAAAEQ
jgi:Uma2 family endonuclease